MTVATQSILVTYLGDDIAVSFPFTFPIYDEDHLVVYFQDLTTRLLVLVNSSNYNVTGIGNENGGSVVFLVAPTAANNVIIARLLPFTQDLDVENQGGFYPENFESELDLIEMQVQQVNQEVNRSVRGPLDNAWPELPTAPIRAAQLLGFTDDDNAYPTVDTFDIFFNMLASILQAGFGIEITVGDGIITITNTAPGGAAELQECWLLEDASAGGGGGSAGDAEAIRDVIGTALQGLGCVIVLDDPANTITVDCTQDATAEVIRDVMGVALVAGTDITIVPSDGGNTITINSTAGVGGFQPLDATLSGIAATAPVANEILYATGADTFNVTTLTPFARTLLDDANAAAMLATLGIAGAGTGSFSANTLSVSLPLTSGSLLIQGGTGSLAADSTGSIVFPTAYSTAPVCIVSGGLSTSTQEGDVHGVGNPSTTGVSISNTAGGGAVTYNWIAIGKA